MPLSQVRIRQAVVSSDRLRVLLLVDAATFHGERISGQLRCQGVNVLTVSLEKGSIRHLNIKSLGPIRSLWYLLSIPAVRAVVRRFNPDVVNAHFASGYGFVAAGSVARGGPPILLNLWGSDILLVPHKSWLHKLKSRWALKKASFVLADSEYLLGEARKLGKLPEARVIYWGIEQEYLSLHKTSYELNRPMRVIVPRAHEAVYNNLFIVEALSSPLKESRIELTFPTFGGEHETFKRKSCELVGDRLRYYDRLPRPDFLKLMAEHDVYLSASRSDSSPVSLIEAMALGLIPVCASIEGVKEWLCDKSGFLYRQNDRQDLNDLMTRLASEGNCYENMRRGNLERVRREAIFERNVAEQIDLMRWLAGR